MPRRPRKNFLRKDRLTDGRESYLDCGFIFFPESDSDKFESLEEAKNCWFQYREEIMARWRAEKRAGRRPWGYWLFEKGIDTNKAEGNQHHLFEERLLLKFEMVEDWEAPETYRRCKHYLDRDSIERRNEPGLEDVREFVAGMRKR